MASLFANRRSCAVAFLQVMLGAVNCLPAPASADNTDAQALKTPQTVVVEGKRVVEPVPDEQLQTRAETALHDDPFFYDAHVTVRVENGVVHLEGLVLDAQDVADAIRIVRRHVAGVKRVVNELDVCSCDGGV